MVKDRTMNETTQRGGEIGGALMVFFYVMGVVAVIVGVAALFNGDLANGAATGGGGLGMMWCATVLQLLQRIARALERGPWREERTTQPGSGAGRKVPEGLSRALRGR